MLGLPCLEYLTLAHLVNAWCLQSLTCLTHISCQVKGGFQLLDLIIPELKSHVIPIDSSAPIGGKFICKKNPLQDLLSSLNVVISTNERT